MTATTDKPEAVTILLDAWTDLQASGDLTAGVPYPDPDVPDDAYTALYWDTLDNRARLFAAAYRAEAQRVGAEEGIDIEVLDHDRHPDRETSHPYDDEGDTWERVLWQQIHDRTPAQPWAAK